MVFFFLLIVVLLLLLVCLLVLFGLFQNTMWQPFLKDCKIGFFFFLCFSFFEKAIRQLPPFSLTHLHIESYKHVIAIGSLQKIFLSLSFLHRRTLWRSYIEWKVRLIRTFFIEFKVLLKLKKKWPPSIVSLMHIFVIDLKIASFI
jgi:hypothetical protein